METGKFGFEYVVCEMLVLGTVFVACNGGVTHPTDGPLYIKEPVS
jgi:hypothetical protein